MSNLQLPSLDYAKLDRMLPPLKTGETVGRNVKLGYKTVAYRFRDEICIMHHETTIATLGLWAVAITPHGWNSTTTANRLHKVMADNRLWGRYSSNNDGLFTVAIRQGQLVIITPDDNKGTPIPYYGVVFQMVAGQWRKLEDPHAKVA